MESQKFWLSKSDFTKIQRQRLLKLSQNKKRVL